MQYSFYIERILQLEAMTAYMAAMAKGTMHLRRKKVLQRGTSTIEGNIGKALDEALEYEVKTSVILNKILVTEEDRTG